MDDLGNIYEQPDIINGASLNCSSLNLGGGNLHIGGTSSKIYLHGATIQSSDNRLKQNECGISGLSVIKQLLPQKYQKTDIKYPEDYTGDISGNWKWETGFIAQDVLQIEDISYCVNHDNSINADGVATDVYGLNYNDIFVYNVGATQELDAKVTLLEQENSTLKTALNILLVAAGQNTI